MNKPIKIIMIMYTFSQILFNYSAFCQIEIPSSFNPAGSGARALGMGNAFIAASDDATAASWNPGGLIQLERPEMSLVGSFFQRKEDISFGTNPEANDIHALDESDINFFSIAYPFEYLNRNMIVSFTYQHLYDMFRQWNINFNFQDTLSQSTYTTNYQQKGRLSAVGLSYGIQILPNFSAGMTLNIWDDQLTYNHWSQTYYSILSETDIFDDHFLTIRNRNESYRFDGINVNIGFLYEVSLELRIGMVLKTPFKADLEHGIHETFNEYYTPAGNANSELTVLAPSQETRREKLKMPMSVGIGIMYRIMPQAYVSADIFRTEWDDFILINHNGTHLSPISNITSGSSQIDPTYQVRMGGEYRHRINDEFIIPIRCGLFYDPAPSEHSPDDYYGVSLGSGIKTKHFSFDIAWQSRFGNNINEDILTHMRFSEDMTEHKLFSSVIVYF